MLWVILIALLVFFHGLHKGIERIESDLWDIKSDISDVKSALGLNRDDNDEYF